MKNSCVIVAGGDCDISSLENECIDKYVIAADSGFYHCQDASVTPNLLIGDFDSYSGQLPQNIETIKLPVQKDDTDLMFAVRCACERKFDEILIIGGYGSRPDQNMAMFQTLSWLSHNAPQTLFFAKCIGFEVFAISNGSRVFKSCEHRYLSVFSFDGIAKGVTIKGAEYELDNATISSSYPVGVSNVAIEDTFVSVKDGTLLIMLVDKNI